ncbi:MAG: TonB family protein [Flavobacteriales bacterium]
MRHLTPLLLLLLVPQLALAQKRKKEKGPSEQEVRQALVAEAEAAFKAGDLATAESKYTQALRLWNDRADRYQRALVRVAQGDSAGYCTDLATFGGNDELQKKLYRSGCSRRDSVPFAATGLATSRFPGATEALTYTYRHEGRTVYKLYNAQKEHMVSFFVLAGDTAFAYCDTLPSFPGGEKALYSFLGTNTKYPAQAMDNDRSGTVYVRFRVGTDGAISNIHVFQGAYHALDDEAARVVGTMPAWNPGQWQGRPVPVLYNLPVRFTLR